MLLIGGDGEALLDADELKGQQVTARVTGHVLGVVVAHDRAVATFPRRNTLRGQYPLLVTMVFYTLGGIALLLGT